MRAYEYTHVVGFAETNFLGNVYYVNHLAWQGRCREMFLRDHAPSILDELQKNLRMVTIRCNCEYFHELAPFDIVIVRMRLGEIVQNRVTMLFEYWRKDPVASGAPAARNAHDVAPGAHPLLTSSFDVKGAGQNEAPTATPESLIARGEQQIGCMLFENGRLTPTPVPAVLRDALKPFGAM